MSETDPVMAEIAEAVAVLHSGERARARSMFSALWQRIGEQGDALHRCTLAHHMADAQNDPRDELLWDKRALAAAEALRAEEQRAQSDALHAFLPSLHLNLAADHHKLGDHGRAREHLARAREAAEAEPDTPLGRLTGEAIARLSKEMEPRR